MVRRPETARNGRGEGRFLIGEKGGDRPIGIIVSHDALLSCPDHEY